MNIKTLQEKIENAWENRRLLSDEVTMNAIDATIDLLDRGELRVATPSDKGWQVHEWIKKELTKGTEKTVIPVVLEKNSIELKEEENINVKIAVRALKGQYKDFEKLISVTRAKRAENEDVALEPLEMYVQGIKSEIGKEVSISSNVTEITEDDIVVIFKTFDNGIDWKYKKLTPLHIWAKKDIDNYIKQNRLILAPEVYSGFRNIDIYKGESLEWLKNNFPDDYQKWVTKYPMAQADFIRWQEYGK